MTDRSRHDINPNYKTCFARMNNDYSCNESQREHQRMLEIAKAIKKATGSRNTPRYIVKKYGSLKALQQKLNWINGCIRSI